MDFEHEKRLTEIEERSKSNSHRIDSLEKRQDNLDELVGTVKVLAVREENVESDVKSLTGKSGKLWDGMVEKIIMLVVAAVIGFILAKIGF